MCLKLNEKSQSTDTVPEMTELLELPDEGFKAAILKHLHEQLGTCFKQMEV